MSNNNQLGLFELEQEQKVNLDDLEIANLNKVMERVELARVCIGHKQYERGANNLLLVRKEINKLIKSLKNRS